MDNSDFESHAVGCRVFECIHVTQSDNAECWAYWFASNHTIDSTHTVREKGPHAYGPHATQKFSMIPKSVQDKIPQWFRPRARRCLGLLDTSREKKKGWTEGKRGGRPSVAPLRSLFGWNKSLPPIESKAIEFENHVYTHRCHYRMAVLDSLPRRVLRPGTCTHTRFHNFCDASAFPSTPLWQAHTIRLSICHSFAVRYVMRGVTSSLCCEPATDCGGLSTLR